jgi:hypothetical protein
MRLQYILIAFLMFASLGLMADPPGPDGPGSGDGGPLPGGGAPIGGGSVALIAMAAAYGGRKIFKMQKNTPDYTVLD